MIYKVHRPLVVAETLGVWLRALGFADGGRRMKQAQSSFVRWLFSRSMQLLLE